jgi:NAD(P)-dependent dehydrogenase (short-subunit alcohol dehydrogenase family)
MLQSKVFLVTGAAGGIGRAAALAAVRAGASVFAADIDADGAELTARLVREAGGQAGARGCDMSSATEVAALVDAAKATFGRIDCAFNNAGIEGSPAPVAALAEEDFDRVISVNLKGVWLAMKAELAVMLEQGAGAIVNTASVAGLVGTPGYAAYIASKHGVAGLTKSAALAYAPRGIRVNAVCPGFIETAMTERIFAEQPERKAGLMTRIAQGRFGTPEEIADAVVWMCSDGARYMNGHMLAVDGGYVAM